MTENQDENRDEITIHQIQSQLPLEIPESVYHWVTNELSMRDARIEQLEESNKVTKQRSLKNKASIKKITFIILCVTSAVILELLATLNASKFAEAGFNPEKIQAWFHWASGGCIAAITLVFGTKINEVVLDFFDD